MIDRDDWTVRDGHPYDLSGRLRIGALVGMLLLTAAYVSVLYEITTVVGESRRLLAVVAVALLVATILAPIVEPRRAATIALALLGGGLGYYVLTVPIPGGLLDSIVSMIGDTLALLTGLTVLRMTEVGLWAVCFAPAPVFLSWYLTLHRQYATATVVGGVTLSIFVLTGDAGTLTTLLGVVGAAAAIGAGDLDAHGATLPEADVLAIVLATMIAVSLLVSAVPGGEAQPLTPDVEGERQTMEESVVTADEQRSVGGPVELSPEVRFTIQSEEAGDGDTPLWRTNAYDRYTGDGWVQSGDTVDYSGELDPPESDSESVVQEVRAETDIGVMPALWKPTDVAGTQTQNVQVTPAESFAPTQPLSAGDTYTVYSERPTPSEEALVTADNEDVSIDEEYTSLPDDTPDRVGEATEEILNDTDAEGPYEKAEVIESWLMENRGYSLDVESPDGDVTDEFLFEMEEGYCVYFATSMATMLRTQDIPTRYVVGYSEGQRVSEDEWVLRGTNAHAWVEVYIEGEGWVTFDPTPPSDRVSTADEVVEEAREDGDEDVDTEESAALDGDEWTPTPDPEENRTDDDQESGDGPEINQTVDEAVAPGEGEVVHRDEELLGGGDIDDPGDFDLDEFEGDEPGLDIERVGAAVALMIGIAAGVRRSGAASAAHQTVVMRWQRARGTPDEDAEQAFRRLSYLLALEYRERRRGETVSAYLSSLDRLGLDDRAHRVAEIRQRARYGDGIDRAEAEEAIAIVDDLVEEHGGLVTMMRERIGQGG